MRAWGYTEGANYLLYSSYSSAFWTVDGAVDAGRISMGLYAQHYRPTITKAGVVTEARGSQTWTGSGTARTTTATDISGLTNLMLIFNVGAYHAQPAAQQLTAVVGMTNAAGDTFEALRTQVVKGGQMVWVSVPVADLDAGVTPDPASAYFYCDVTITGASSKWWFDGALVCDATRVPTHRPITKGASVVKVGHGFAWKIPVLCPSCGKAEFLLKPSERYGDFRQADWVEIRSEIESL